MNSEVSGFLKRFHTDADIDGVFTNGCCYWFAYILFTRFLREGAEIVYDPIKGHFGTRIYGRVFDITGDVTDDHFWVPFKEMDASQKKRVERDCIMF